MIHRITLTLFITVLASYAALAQVGINTDTPSAELDIATTDTGLPGLRLAPQLNPTGSTAGQIAVIGSTARRPFLYDPVRSKWLGLQLTGWQFNQGTTRSSDGSTVRYGGNQESTTAGPLMPRPGTVVYVTAKAVNGNQTKQFNIIFKNSSDVIVASQSITLTGGEAVLDNLNTDFPAGSYMILEADAAGTAVTDVSLVVWTKWRPQN